MIKKKRIYFFLIFISLICFSLFFLKTIVIKNDKDDYEDLFKFKKLKSSADSSNYSLDWIQNWEDDDFQTGKGLAIDSENNSYQIGSSYSTIKNYAF